MTDQPDLFPEAVQRSPYLEFVERHGIVTGDLRKESQSLVSEMMKTADDDEDDYFFFAYQKAGYADLDSAHEDCVVRFGRASRDACHNLAMEFNLEGWEGVNW